LSVKPKDAPKSKAKPMPEEDFNDSVPFWSTSQKRILWNG
jgi:hypothetical protein